MPYEINETHDPKLESWVESANDPETDFPIQNLAVCEYLGPEHGDGLGVRIGNSILDIAAACRVGLLQDSGVTIKTLERFTWGGSVLANLGTSGMSQFRAAVQRLLSSGTDASRIGKARELLIDADICVVHQPLPTRDYTDFYASLHHATNVGSMFRPDNPLLPNYKHIPIGYHGRASSIVPSGTPVRRPVGQQAPAEEGGSPQFGPCKMLDFELEMGMIIGRGNELGEPISIADAEDHVFGMCIVNDWSARDLQKWEYQPLGPFLAKSFATSVSPYIVTMEALAPFRTPAFARAAGDPQPLPYLDSEYNRAHGGIDITCEVWLATAEMRKRDLSPVRICKSSFKDLYWTLAQFVAHHTANGCNLQPGDLLASGTISGPTRDSRGSMLELTWDGDPWANPPVVVPGTQRTPIKLPTGEERKFLADGDEVIIKAYCEREGFRRIGFGECRGTIEAART